MTQQLAHIKAAHMSKSVQIVVIDVAGRIVDSCNSIIDLDSYTLEPAQSVIPFLEGVFHSVKDAELGASLDVECVNMNLGERHGVFDLQLRVENYTGKPHIMCVLEDRTKQYEYWLQIQQERNKSIMDVEIIAKQAAIIKEKNTQITDSINYARHIQRGILPKEDNIKQMLPQSFVLFRPRDVIGGDFYWIKEHLNKVFFTSADSTGHGVPGALLSMVGASLLKDALSVSHNVSPSDVLSKVRTGIINFLNEGKKDNHHFDGMDTALCAWDKENNQLEFAGANNPLVIVRSKQETPLEIQKGATLRLDAVVPKMENDTHFLYELKGDSIPVGYYYENLRPFTNFRMQLYPGDFIYNYTDGIKDQFGGPKFKKLGNKRLLQGLLEVASKPLEDQKELIEKLVLNWMGKEEQVDDMCIIGVQV